MPKRKILLIDDEKKFCQMMKQRLEHQGVYDVTIAYSGPEGIACASNTTFDLVITDFKMPEMNGAEVVKALKTMQPALPVLLFSIYYDDQTVITPDILHDADGLISKPINYDALYRTIEEALARRQ